MKTMFDIIQEIIFQITGDEVITPETDLVRDLALNSFDIVTIVCAFEKQFNIDIPTRDVWKLNQVSDIVDYLTERGIVSDE